MLRGPLCFQDAQQQTDFAASLSAEHTIHAYEALVSNCLCDLVKQFHDLRAKVRKEESPKGSTKKKTPKKSIVGSVRRSSRIKQAHESPSE